MARQRDKDTSEKFRRSLERRLTMAAEEEAVLASTIADLQTQLKAVRQRREAAAKLFELEFGEAPPPQSRPAEGSAAREAVELGPLTGLPWSEAIHRVLEEAGEPLHVKEIWRRLADGGFATSSRDPLRSIVAVVLRSDGVVRADPNTYGLAEHLRGGKGKGASTTRSAG